MMDFVLQMYSEQMASDLNKMNQTVEDAVTELVNIFLHKAQLTLQPVDDSCVTETMCMSVLNVHF